MRSSSFARSQVWLIAPCWLLDSWGMFSKLGVTISAGPAATTRRKHGRIRAHDVHSTFGRVLDLSASGLRVLTRRGLRTGQIRILEVHTADGAFAAQVRVTWTHRSGLFMRQVGLEFIDLPPQARGILNSCARVIAS